MTAPSDLTLRVLHSRLVDEVFGRGLDEVRAFFDHIGGTRCADVHRAIYSGRVGVRAALGDRGEVLVVVELLDGRGQVVAHVLSVPCEALGLDESSVRGIFESAWVRDMERLVDGEGEDW